MDKTKLIVHNRKAFYHYEISEKIEAGIELLGSEVKSIRAGQVNIQDSFAKVFNGELWLMNCHISPYTQGYIEKPDPLRDRKLLIHKKQINRLMGKINEKGLALVATKLYWLGNHIKVELGLGKGKKHHDKRAAIKEREVKRELDRAHRYG